MQTRGFVILIVRGWTWEVSRIDGYVGSFSIQDACVPYLYKDQANIVLLGLGVLSPWLFRDIFGINWFYLSQYLH